MAESMSVERAPFGCLENGTEVDAVWLRSPLGYAARILSFGGILQSFIVPDADGVWDDIVLGFDQLQGYVDDRAFIGATIGRFANRIAGGQFALDGHCYQLAQNEGATTLHGGGDGWYRRVWSVDSVHASENAATVRLSIVSRDGDMGFPGEVRASVAYSLTNSGVLTITHEGSTDAPTVLNMTHHSYFNLSGHQRLTPILDHHLAVPAERFTPIGADLIPTGEIKPVAGTPFEFGSGTSLDQNVARAHDQLKAAGGIDHNLVIDAPADGTLRQVANLRHGPTGRTLDIASDQPGLHVYLGSGLSQGTIGKGGASYFAHAGLCLEPQLFPDAPNQPHFPSARLDPGQGYRHAMALTPGVAAKSAA